MKAPRLLLAALAVLPLPLSAQDLRRPPTPEGRAAMVAQGWEASRDALGKLLIQVYQPGGPARPGSTGVTNYRAWLLLWKWCDLLSRNEQAEAARFLARHLRLSDEGESLAFVPAGRIPPEGMKPAALADAEKILSDPAEGQKALGKLLPDDLLPAQDRPVSQALEPAVLGEWIADDQLSRLLFGNLSEDDYVPGVLRILQDIRRADPQKFREYRALAVAIALVYDQKRPGFWPHDQVVPDLVPIRNISPQDWFKFWVKMNESKGALLDLRKLGPEQIKFVVDAPLDESEFDWARKNVKYARAEFAKAFSSVDYDHDRIPRRAYDWTEGDYTLLDLRRKGGICVDQAYYAMVAGKARCLPTLFFTGQGVDGGHAWFGYMKADDKWELDCGRYENQNYAVGEALDPQTWQPISDHQLKQLAGRFRDRLEYAASRDDLMIAGIFEAGGDKARAGKALDSAIQVCPENPEAWDAKSSFLNRVHAPSSEIRRHHLAALNQFKTDRDLKARHQAALAEVARIEGDAAGAESLEKQIISQNKNRRSDLSVGLAAQKINELAESGQVDEAFAEYRRQVAVLGRNGGGNFFYDVVRPLVVLLVAKGDKAQALEAVRLARKALAPEANSILDQDMRKLENGLERNLLPPS